MDNHLFSNKTGNDSPDCIVFVTHRFVVGGVENVFLNLSRYLLDKKIILITICDEYDYKLLAELPSNVTLFEKKFKNRNVTMLSLLRIWFDVSGNIDLRNATVVNFSDTLGSLMLSYLLKGKRKMSWVHCNPHMLKNSRSYRMYLWVLNRFSNVVSLCDRQKNLLLSISPSLINKVKLCTNLVNIEKIKFLQDVRLEHTSFTGNYILMVARFDLRSKDFFTLIESYSRIRPMLRDEYKLVLLGDGPDFENVLNFVRERGLEGDIILPGVDLNPYRWMKNATALIHSTRSEGFPLVLLEAMLCGLPIISSDCDTGPSDVLAGGLYGRLFPVGDVNALVNAMHSVLEDKNELFRLSQLSLQRGLALTNIAKQQIKEVFND